ncbi:hypothetical protein S83_055373, partial [Arachis hypogaea]
LQSVSSVQIEPIFVQIDRLNLVLKENSDYERPPENNASITPSSASSNGSGYGFADKISDGMTIQIQTVNLLLETHGGARPQGEQHGHRLWHLSPYPICCCIPQMKAGISQFREQSPTIHLGLRFSCTSQKLFALDKFSHPPCLLVQPSIHSVKRESFHVPEFEQQWQLIEGIPLICLRSLQIVPSALPPFFACQTVIDCPPLMCQWTGSYGSFGQGPDPACFSLWEGQPIDAIQRNWSARAAQITFISGSMYCPTCTLRFSWMDPGLWRCVVLKGAWIEVAMATGNGSPLLKVPPLGGIVRVDVSCEQFLSNCFVEQLFFVLVLYMYFGRVSEKIAVAGKSKQLEGIKNKSSSEKLMDITPSDSAFVGNDLFISATHRTFGGVIVISSTSRWEGVQIDCVDAEKHIAGENGSFLSSGENIPSSSDILETVN